MYITERDDDRRQCNLCVFFSIGAFVAGIRVLHMHVLNLAYIVMFTLCKTSDVNFDENPFDFVKK